MKTLLVPVDFTATSENAVNFAAAWSKQYGYDRIILLKSFYDSVFENIAVAEGYANFNQECLNSERQNATEQLQQAGQQLTNKIHPNVKVMTATSEMPLLRAVLDLVEAERPELIILGSDHYRYSSESFVAGHLISLAKASPVKVLIVPATYTYRLVTDALVPFTFDFLDSVEKVNSLRSSPQWHDIQLHVLNVDATEQYRNRDENFRERENRLHAYLKNMPHQIHYSNDKNVITGIRNFVNEHDIQLIIALPGKHSFLYALTHKSISEAIYRNARQPVLILK